MITQEKIAEIRARASVVEVISDYVTLKKVGRNHVGLCPFHGEKTPSFTVNDEKGIFHCFSCKTGGSVFNFLMQYDHLSFPEAVEYVGKRYGIAVEHLGKNSNSGEDADRDGLYRNGTVSLGMGWQVPRMPGLGEVDWPMTFRELTRAGRIGLAVVLFAAGQILADVLIFSLRPLYGAYAEQPERLLGLSPLGDQRVAGLVMMVEQLLTLGTFVGLLLLAQHRRLFSRTGDERRAPA